MSLAKRTIALIAVVVIGSASVACDTATPDPGPIELSWREVTLPPPSAGERIVLRAGAVCDGHWYLVGAYTKPGWVTRPAAWTSLDGQTWQVLTVSAHSFDGVKHEMTTAACKDGRLVALGAKVGGAHGNPRISSYHLAPTADGTGEALTEVDASFELYGGPHANNVGRMSSGPPGYLIVGNRTAGAAVWFSPDGAAAFEIVEGAPVLGSSPGLSTWANDSVFHDGGWVVVGAATSAGRPARDGASWRSPDAHTWSALPVETSTDSNEITVVADLNGNLIALGQRGGTFQTWRLQGGSWRLLARFGDARYSEIDGIQTASVAVDLAAAGSRLFGVVQARGAFELWSSTDGGSWQSVTPPIALPAAAGRTTTIVGIPGQTLATGQLLLVMDDGTAGHAFVATVGQTG